MAISNFRFSNMAEFGAPLGLYKPASSEVEPKEAPRHFVVYFHTSTGNNKTPTIYRRVAIKRTAREAERRFTSSAANPHVLFVKLVLDGEVLKSH